MDDTAADRVVGGGDDRDGKLVVVKIQQKAWLIVALCIAGMLACFWLPVPKDQVSWLFYVSVTESVGVFITHVGATALLFGSLSGFTAQFKLAFIKLFAGITLLAVATIQLPIITILGQLSTSPWVKYGFIVLPYLAAYMLIYAGARSYARLFGVLGWVLSRMFSVVVAGVMGALVTILPHAPSSGVSEIQFDATLGFSMFQAVILFMAALLSLKAARRASVKYIEPMALISWYAFVLVAGSIVLIGWGFVPDGLRASGYLAYPFQLVGGLLLLKAAVSFHAIGEAETEVVQTRGQRRQDDEAVLIDINVYLASLVSNTRAVDAILNPMRAITARMSDTKSLSQSDMRVLMRTYDDLVDYLANKEPVRRHSPEELVRLVEHALRKRLVNSSMWADLSRRG